MIKGLGERVIIMNNAMGCLYKTIRLYRGMTKKEVCASVMISRQYLSTLEDTVDYLSISKSMNDRLQRTFHFTLDQDKILAENFILLRNEFVRACLFVQNQKALETMEKLHGYAERIINTVYFPEYLLLRLIEMVILKRTDSELNIILNTLEKVKYHFDPKTRQLYYLILSVYELEILDFEKSEQHLLEAYSMSNDPHLQSIICFFQAKIALMNDNSLESLSFVMKARELFDSTCNYRRSVQCISFLGKIWMHIGEYKGAAEYCYEAIKAASTMDYHAVIGSNYRVLSWIYLHDNEYQKSIDMAYKASQLGESSSMMCFHASFASWKSKNFAQMSRWIASGLNKCDSDFGLSKRLLNTLKRLEKDPSLEETALLTLMKITDNAKIKDLDLLRLLYYELAMLYKEKEEYEPALTFYEKYYSYKS